MIIKGYYGSEPPTPQTLRYVRNVELDGRYKRHGVSAVYTVYRPPFSFLARLENFVNGKRHGKCLEFFKIPRSNKVRVKARGNYADGKKHGMFIQYCSRPYESEQSIQHISNYTEGKAHGLQLKSTGIKSSFSYFKHTIQDILDSPEIFNVRGCAHVTISYVDAVLGSQPRIELKFWWNEKSLVLENCKIRSAAFASTLIINSPGGITFSVYNPAPNVTADAVLKHELSFYQQFFPSIYRWMNPLIENLYYDKI